MSTSQGMQCYIDDSKVADRIVGSFPGDRRRLRVCRDQLSLEQQEQRIDAARFGVGTRLWMEKLDLTDADLNHAVGEMKRELIDADLDGRLVKKRVALVDKGKRRMSEFDALCQLDSDEWHPAGPGPCAGNRA